MMLMLNNRDSFVFNLARYFEELGEEICVVDSHETTLTDIRSQKPRAIIISPGPCAPQQAGISLEAVKTFAGDIPILGVCLGHQVIAEAFGWRAVRSASPTHGLAANITHSASDLFAGLPSPLPVGLYHSLIVEPVADHIDLQVDARSPQGEVMALSHRDLPIYGVQFHPESVLTEHGYDLLENFLRLARLNVPA
ncbi:MAG: aminodeoxychorismate/anthranilate synthase component II [Henriciella sp.]|nr:aminodeoxychorismate/anthranilate synthase component II [Henriciella sp.]